MLLGNHIFKDHSRELRFPFSQKMMVNIGSLYERIIIELISCYSRCVSPIQFTLKRKGCPYDEMLITGCTGNYQSGNFRTWTRSLIIFSLQFKCWRNFIFSAPRRFCLRHNSHSVVEPALIVARWNHRDTDIPSNLNYYGKVSEIGPWGSFQYPRRYLIWNTNFITWRSHKILRWCVLLDIERVRGNHYSTTMQCNKTTDTFTKPKYTSTNKET